MNLPGMPAAAQALTAAVRALAADPADQVRLLLALADIADTGLSGNLVRRAALVQLARACAAYQPTSYDDAQQLRATVCALLDAEIFRAGDAGDDGVYTAFRALRVSVARDLAARGDPLPRLRTVTVLQSVPAAVLAHRLYGDARRADELVQRTKPIHPGFMPTTLTVLSR